MPASPSPRTRDRIPARIPARILARIIVTFPPIPPGQPDGRPPKWAPTPARVYLTGWILPATMADADLVAGLMRDHERRSRAEPGCLVFEIFRSMADPMRFAVREIFADRPAFEAHQIRTRASDWWRQTGHIERDYRVSEGE